MDAIDVALIALVAVLSTAFALTLLARLQDFKLVRRLNSELAAAHSRIAELEPQPERRFSRT